MEPELDGANGPTSVESYIGHSSMGPVGVNLIFDLESGIRLLESWLGYHHISTIIDSLRLQIARTAALMEGLR